MEINKIPDSRLRLRDCCLLKKREKMTEWSSESWSLAT